MKQILFLVFSGILTFEACSTTQKGLKASFNQGISGFVKEITGNQMPALTNNQNTPKALQTEVFVYELTRRSQVTGTPDTRFYTAINSKLVASAVTDSAGSFSIPLPVGNYSVFVKLGDRFYANLFDTQNNIAPFEVAAGKITPVQLLVNYKATY
ncbi:MAG: hypothetical protein RLZZ28_2656 [Bacteroidota bacterium]